MNGSIIRPMMVVEKRRCVPNRDCGRRASVMRKVIYIVRILMIELGLTAVRVRDVTRVATAKTRALDKNNRIKKT